MIRDTNHMQYFPYPTFRDNQKTLIKDVSTLIRDRNNILLVAPNGTGKTIIALSGILPVIQEKNLKLIYLCRTHAQADRVIRELQKIHENLNEEQIIGISIRGRTQMCLNPTMRRVSSSSEATAKCKELRMGGCRWYTKGKSIKGRVNEKAPQLLTKPMTGDAIKEYAKKKILCPYFLSKYLLKEVKVVVCNYNWVFNPQILYGFLRQMEIELGKCVLVVDECHNIPEVATSLCSKKLIPAMLTKAITQMANYPQFTERQRKFVRLIRNYINNKKKAINNDEIPIQPDQFLKKIIKPLHLKSISEFRTFIEKLGTYNKELTSSPEEEVGEIQQDYLGTVIDFWRKFQAKMDSKEYFYCVSVRSVNRRKYAALEVVSLDAREITVPLYRRSYATLNLSGTVNPSVFTNLTGLNYKFNDKAYKQYIVPSPFESHNILALIIRGVTTKNDQRVPEMFQKYIRKLSEILNKAPGNVGIFCASYAIMNSLMMYGLKEAVRKANKQLFMEESSLSASENAYMVKDFKSCGEGRGAVLLGVCGGRNAEGEDFPGEAMSTVLIVGIPYPYPSPRIQAKIDYYDNVFHKKGWVFGYLSPAMQRANQASGRPIRKLTDKGAIIFMDGRFVKKKQWIAPWVQKQIRIIPDKKGKLGETIARFWTS